MEQPATNPALKKAHASIDLPFYQRDVLDVSDEVGVSEDMKEERNTGGTHKGKQNFFKCFSRKTNPFEPNQNGSTTSGVTGSVTKEKKRRRRQEAIVIEYEADDPSGVIG